jgi:hypothetical protein
VKGSWEVTTERKEEPDDEGTDGAGGHEREMEKQVIEVYGLGYLYYLDPDADHEFKERLTSFIAARKIDAGTHTAIIVPQMLVNKKPLVEIIFRNVSYMVESKFNFKSGMHHVLNITLNNNPDKVNIEIGGEIENWN